MSGKKLSKFDPDKEREEQRKRLLDKYLDAQARWIREYDQESWDAYKKISNEYKAQFDR